MKRWFSLSIATAIVLLGHLPAFAQVVDDPYKNVGPAGEEKEFVASKVGQPKAEETLAALKQLYAEAAKYYATDPHGHIFLRYTADAKSTQPDATGEPLTWPAFGTALKSGQILLVRLPQSPSADKSADAFPPSTMVEYTVRWQPQPAKAPAASADSTSSSPPPLDDKAGQTGLAATPAQIKKAANDALALIEVVTGPNKSFMNSHPAFKKALGELHDAATAVASQKDDPTPDLVKTFNTSLDDAITVASNISERPTGGKNKPAKGVRVESQDAVDAALNLDKQLKTLRKNLHESGGTDSLDSPDSPSTSS